MKSRTALAVAMVSGLVVSQVLGVVSSSQAHPPPPPGCAPATPNNCFYRSNLNFTMGVVQGSLTDPNRDDYPIPLLVRYPVEASTPRPVVIWNHGGSPALNARARSEEWGTLLAKAGYVVIHPSRMPITDTTPFESECSLNGFDTPLECGHWVAQWRYGPLTTRFLTNHLDDVEALDPALDGLIDPERIAVAGHSAGTGSVHAAAGAWQQWELTGPKYVTRSSKPIAFLASGPQGPMYAGFSSGFQAKDKDAGYSEHSWVDIDRPFMFITGVGDETNEDPVSRTSGFLTSIGNDDKFLVWDSEPTAVHETMDIHKCDTALQKDHCKWIASTGLAFFDAVLRSRAAAQTWLQTDALQILSGDAIDLQRR